MKKFFAGFVLLSLLGLSPSLQAQSTAAPIEYSERVPAEGAGKQLLYQRAVSWSENNFAYSPKSDVKADPAACSLRLRGTSKVKTVTTSGKEVVIPIRFEFVFRSTDNGYEYSVGSFLLIPDTKQPVNTVALDEYTAQLAAERTNAQTKNDRRVRAQANSLASEVALSFRSFMNSKETEGDGAVGLK